MRLRRLEPVLRRALKGPCAVPSGHPRAGRGERRRRFDRAAPRAPSIAPGARLARSRPRTCTTACAARKPTAITSSCARCAPGSTFRSIAARWNARARMRTARPLGRDRTARAAARVPRDRGAPDARCERDRDGAHGGRSARDGVDAADARNRPRAASAACAPRARALDQAAARGHARCDVDRDLRGRRQRGARTRATATPSRPRNRDPSRRDPGAAAGVRGASRGLRLVARAKLAQRVGRTASDPRGGRDRWNIAARSLARVASRRRRRLRLIRPQPVPTLPRSGAAGSSGRGDGLSKDGTAASAA